MKKIISLIIVVMVLLTFTGCSFEKNKVSRKVVDYSKKITKVSEGFTKQNNFIVVAKNNSKANIDLIVKVDFYDINDSLISTENAYLNGVGPKAEVAVQIANVPDGYSRYEISFKAETSIYSKTFYNEVELTLKKDFTVTAEVKNNTKEIINYISAAIVYYKDNVIVGYDSNSVSDVKPRESAIFNFYQPNDFEYNEVEYDKYKVYINETYSYIYTY